MSFTFAVSGCGSSSKTTSTVPGAATPATTTGQTHFAKTKFVLHAGLAFGAFHRWIYKPLRAGDFGHPFSHKLAIIKAGLAAAFVVHELKFALADAQADPLLSKVVAPLAALHDKLSGLVSGIKSGHPDAAAIESANGSIGTVHGLASSAGQPITEHLQASPAG